MIKLYVTYGFGSNLANCFSIVEAESGQAAFDKVREVCGQSYAFTYPHDVWHGENGRSQEDRYGLTEVPLQPQRKTS